MSNLPTILVHGYRVMVIALKVRIFFAACFQRFPGVRYALSRKETSTRRCSSDEK
nr:MAG: hypothetical protein [Molluscum contagiosum virus]